MSANKTEKKKKAGATKRREVLPAWSDEEDDEEEEGSICGQTSSKRPLACAICKGSESPKWYNCPTSLVEGDSKPSPCVMCEECGLRWRHCE